MGMTCGERGRKVKEKKDVVVNFKKLKEEGK